MEQKTVVYHRKTFYFVLTDKKLSVKTPFTTYFIRGVNGNTKHLEALRKAIKAGQVETMPELISMFYKADDKDEGKKQQVLEMVVTKLDCGV